MRIKLDENLPASLASTLTALAHEVHTVAEENLSGSKDYELWEATQREVAFPHHTRSGFLRYAEVHSWNTFWHSAGSSTFAGPELIDSTNQTSILTGRGCPLERVLRGGTGA